MSTLEPIAKNIYQGSANTGGIEEETYRYSTSPAHNAQSPFGSRPEATGSSQLLAQSIENQALHPLGISQKRCPELSSGDL